MKIYRCLVVDDEPLARQGLREFIGRAPDLYLVAEARNVKEGRDILRTEEVDILFMDIEMPRISGIEFLENSIPVPAVIITSAYDQYAIKGFDLAVQDYLLKPFTLKRFEKAVQKARDHISMKKEPRPSREAKDQETLFIKSEGTIHKLKIADLLYVEAMQNYMICHMREGRLIAHITLKALEEQLPSELFVRTHKSYLVNIVNIQKLDSHELVIEGRKVPISRNYKVEAYRRILKDQLISR